MDRTQHQPMHQPPPCHHDNVDDGVCEDCNAILTREEDDNRYDDDPDPDPYHIEQAERAYERDLDRMGGSG